MDMLRLMLRLIDGATRKLEVALEFSCTLIFTLTDNLALQRGKFIDLSDLVSFLTLSANKICCN